MAIRTGDTSLPPGSPCQPRGLCGQGGLCWHLQTLQLREAEESTWLDCADQVVLQVPVGRQTQTSGCAGGAQDLTSAPSTADPAQQGPGHELTLSLPQPPPPTRGFQGSPSLCSPPARASLAAFHPIALSLSLQRAEGRREAPCGSQRGDASPSARSKHCPPVLPSPPLGCFQSSHIPAGCLLPVG